MLDEPAAGLDDFEADELSIIVRRLATDWGIGILLVEHKVDLVMSISDRLTVLAGGRILAQGTPNEVSHDPLVLDAYLGSTQPDETSRGR